MISQTPPRAGPGQGGFPRYRLPSVWTPGYNTEEHVGFATASGAPPGARGRTIGRTPPHFSGGLTGTSSRRRGGFTLIELLVVVAVIVVLLSLLAPSFLHVKRMVYRIWCQSNEHQLLIGWQQYSVHNSGELPWSGTDDPYAWVSSDAYGDSAGALTHGAIWPYTQGIDLYRCPSAYFKYYATYSITAYMNGQHISATYRPGTLTRFGQIMNPSGTCVFVEEFDNRGYNMGSFAPFQFGPYQWWDVVAGNHEGGDIIGFVDGRAEYWRWVSPLTLTFYGGHTANDPGSVDCDRLRAAFFGDDKITPGW
ncbi:MAG: prepilin-type N-terminal cleavage/methylation domain-containing protein [Planctomycetota bacterium]|nr:prepilin-type N-terminal cleavage/methylation domain-containing protein [Planctomycetota bacterium]